MWQSPQEWPEPTSLCLPIPKCLVCEAGSVMMAPLMRPLDPPEWQDIHKALLVSGSLSLLLCGSWQSEQRTPLWPMLLVRKEVQT